MADDKLEGPELKKMVKLAKKKPLAFAFCPGKKKEEHVVMIDRRKGPGILGKAAKKEGTSPKVAFGTMSVNGKLVELTCERVVPKMAKTLKTYFRTQRLMVNIVVLDENGQELESDIEDLPDDPDFDRDDDDTFTEDDADDAVQDAAPDDQEDQDSDKDQSANDQDDADAEQETARDARELAARLKAVQPGVMGAQGPVAEKLKKVMAAAVAQIKAGDLENADRAISGLEAAVAKLGATPPAAPPPPGTPEASAPPQPEPDNAPDAKALAGRAQALKQVIDGIAEPARGKLLAALGAAAGQIKSGDLATADATLTKIETAAAKVTGQSGADQDSAQTREGNEAKKDGDTEQAQEDPNAAKWATAEARLQPLVDHAMAEKRGDLDGINRAFNYARELAADGAFERALAAAGKVAELLKAAQSAEGTAAAAEAREAIPDDVVPYVKSRLAWIDTRKGLRQELEGLKSAIDAATAGIDGLDHVPSKTGVLFSYLDDIDGALEDTLETLVETPDGADREALKSQARQIIDQYKGVLDTDFFKAVDSNGFANTNIRGAALASLQEVSTALAS